MATLSWMTWEEVDTGFKNLKSDDVTLRETEIINEACQVVLDDLSGHFNVELLTETEGVPSQLKRLAIYKARQNAAIIYVGGATSAEKNPEAAYHKSEYDFLLNSIREGFIQVEGYTKPAANKKVSFI